MEGHQSTHLPPATYIGYVEKRQRGRQGYQRGAETWNRQRVYASMGEGVLPIEVRKSVGEWETVLVRARGT